MRWPWQNPTPVRARRVEIEQRLARLEHEIRAGQEMLADRLESLEPLPRMARHVSKTFAIVSDWQEKREAERDDTRRAQETLDTLAHDLMRWVDELAAILQKTAPRDAWHGVHSAWLRQLERALADMGYTEIAVLGRTFDAAVAAAVDTVAYTGDAPPYTMVEVVRRGYARQGKLWRRAEVITVRAEPMEGETSRDRVGDRISSNCRD